MDRRGAASLPEQVGHAVVRTFDPLIINHSWVRSSKHYVPDITCNIIIPVMGAFTCTPVERDSLIFSCGQLYTSAVMLYPTAALFCFFFQVLQPNTLPSAPPVSLQPNLQVRMGPLLPLTSCFSPHRSAAAAFAARPTPPPRPAEETANNAQANPLLLHNMQQMDSLENLPGGQTWLRSGTTDC